MKLAELLIEMKANTASLNKSLNHAEGRITGFANKAKGALAGIGLALGGSGLAAGLFDAAKGAGEYAAKIDMASQATGIATERMSGLALQAQTLGIPLENVTMALSYFDRVTAGLMRSKQGAQALKILGINAHDATGHLKNSAVMLDEVANKMAKMKDSTEKTALAGALFGQGYGLKLIPMLNGGARAMHAAAEEAKQLGLALTEKDAVALHQLSDKLVLSQQRFEGLKMEIGKALLPAISSVMAALTGDADQWRIIWDDLVTVAAKASEGILKVFSYIPGAIGKDFEKASQNAKNWADQLQTDVLLRKAHQNSILKALDTMNKSTHVPLFNQPTPATGHASAALKEQQKFEEQFLKTRLDMYNRLNELTEKQAKRHDVTVLAGDFVKLNGELTAAGTNVLGLGTDWKATFKQMEESAAGIGSGPIGGTTPGFQKRGLGAMRFDMEKLKADAHDLGKEMSQSFTRMIETGQGFKQMLGDLLRQFETFIIKATVFKALGKSLSGTGGFSGMLGGFFSGLSLPGRAGGGPVTAGSLYMVGEEGPELFAPGTSGSIIPGGMGRNGDTFNIDARGAAPGVEHRIARVLQRMQKQSTGRSLAAVHEYHARGGSL